MYFTLVSPKMKQFCTERVPNLYQSFELFTHTYIWYTLGTRLVHARTRLAQSAPGRPGSQKKCVLFVLSIRPSGRALLCVSSQSD